MMSSTPQNLRLARPLIVQTGASRLAIRLATRNNGGQQPLSAPAGHVAEFPASIWSDSMSKKPVVAATSTASGATIANEAATHYQQRRSSQEAPASIPSKIYISGQSSDDVNPTCCKKSALETSKHAHKLEAKTSKRHKPDPDAVETTVQTKARLAETTSGPKLAVLVQEDSATEKSKIPVLAPRIEALNAKLQSWLAAKRQQPPPNPEEVSKRAGLRLEKNRRKAEAQRRKASAATSAGLHHDSSTASAALSSPVDATMATADTTKRTEIAIDAVDAVDALVSHLSDNAKTCLQMPFQYHMLQSMGYGFAAEAIEEVGTSKVPISVEVSIALGSAVSTNPVNATTTNATAKPTTLVVSGALLAPECNNGASTTLSNH
jgi:hypothetical protein